MAYITSNELTVFSSRSSSKWLATFLIMCIAAVQIAMALYRQIHMDEFLFLSRVFEYERGSLSQILQTFHVHLFPWLTYLPIGDFGRLIVARLLMVGLHLATLYFLFGTARVFVSFKGAFCVVMIYATSLFVVQYASSFRADGMIAALFTAALYGMTRPNLTLRILIVSALAIALAGLISIKAIFYIPMIGMAALWRLTGSDNWRRLLVKMVAAAAVAAVVFIVLLLLHVASLDKDVLAVQRPLSGAVNKQLVENNFLDTVWYLVALMIANPLQAILVIAGVIVAISGAVRTKGKERIRALMVTSFATPLLLVFFYRNSFPYFYVFMLPSVPLVTLFIFDNSRFQVVNKLPMLIATLLVVPAVILGVRDLPKSNSNQRSFLAAVRQIFPVPVTYLDGSASVPSFPWAGVYMTSWGMDGYEKSDRPLISQIVSAKRPRFVVADNGLLAAALETGANPAGAKYQFRSEDIDALYNNYIRHWGPIWVAGKRLGDTAGGVAGFDIVINGKYTFESNSPGRIDGKAISPGGVIVLDYGMHNYSGPAAVLRWGDHLPVPGRKPPGELYLIDQALTF